MHDHKANKHMHCFFDVICQVQLFGFIFFITNFVCFINIKNVKNVHTKMSKMSTQKMSKNVKFQKRNFTCLSGIRNSGFLSAQNRLLFFFRKIGNVGEMDMLSASPFRGFAGVALKFAMCPLFSSPSFFFVVPLPT